MSLSVSAALVSLAGYLGFLGVSALEQTPEAPVAVDCEKWLAHPTRDGSWVRLRHCRLDAGDGVSRRWRWLEKDRPKRTLVLFLPLLPEDATDRSEVRAVVATRDPVLLDLVDRLAPLSVHEANAFLDEHGEELNARLTPSAITGVVRASPPDDAREALEKLHAPGAVVLEEGVTPDASDAHVELGAAGVFLLLAVAALVVRPDDAIE